MRLNEKQKEIKEDTKRLLKGESCDNCYYGLSYSQCYLDVTNLTPTPPRNICKKYVSVQKKLLGNSEEYYKIKNEAKGTYKEAVEKSEL